MAEKVPLEEWIRGLPPDRLDLLTDLVTKRLDESILEEDQKEKATEAKEKEERRRWEDQEVCLAEVWLASTSTLASEPSAPPALPKREPGEVWEELAWEFDESVEDFERARLRLIGTQNKINGFRRRYGKQGIDLSKQVAEIFVPLRDGLRAFEEATEAKRREFRELREAAEANAKREKEAKVKEEAEAKEASILRQKELEFCRRQLQLRQAEAAAAREERDRKDRERREAERAANHLRRQADQAHREVRQREVEEEWLRKYPERCKCMRCGRTGTLTRSCPECKAKVLRNLDVRRRE